MLTVNPVLAPGIHPGIPQMDSDVALCLMMGPDPQTLRAVLLGDFLTGDHQVVQMPPLIDSMTIHTTGIGTAPSKMTESGVLHVGETQKNTVVSHFVKCAMNIIC